MPAQKWKTPDGLEKGDPRWQVLCDEWNARHPDGTSIKDNSSRRRVDGHTEGPARMKDGMAVVRVEVVISRSRSRMMSSTGDRWLDEIVPVDLPSPIVEFDTKNAKLIAEKGYRKGYDPGPTVLRPFAVPA